MKTNVEVTKALATLLSQRLQTAEREVTSSVILEIIAEANGYRNWHTYQAASENNGKASPPPVARPKAPKVAPWSPLHGPMTDAQYVKTKGLCCPVCGSAELEGDSIEIENGTANQEVSCSVCDSTWVDRYNLASWIPDELVTLDSAEAFILAVNKWLCRDEGVLTEEYQENLDELVRTAVEQRDVALNDAANPDEQERILSEDESSASSITNDGPLAQLTYLREGYDSDELFLQAMVDWFELSIDSFIR